jgi:hypothetical protein
MVTEMSSNTRATEGSRSPLPVPTEAELRASAIKRLKAKRDFRSHLFVYIVVNTAFWVGWIIDGVINGWQFPWPAFPTVFWGLFVLGHARDLYWHDPLREEFVQREIEELRAASRVHPLDTYDFEDDEICC